jgi:hypothetical protein
MTGVQVFEGDGISPQERDFLREGVKVIVAWPGKRVLKTGWTQEAMNDLVAFHGKDIQKEIHDHALADLFRNRP